jgi:hypothetical protein
MITFPVAIVAAGAVRDVLYSDAAFTGPNGVKHPSGWRVWTPANFKALCPGWEVRTITDVPPVASRAQVVTQKPQAEWTVGTSEVTVGYTVTSRPLQEIKDELKAAVSQKRWEVETGGITVAGALIDTSRESQGMLSGANLMAQTFPSRSVDWKTRSGWVSLPASTVLQLSAAVGSHVQDCFSHERVLHEAIDAAVTPEEALSVNFSTGWPGQS